MTLVPNARLGHSDQVVGITGASGYVGGLIADELVRQGKRVIELGRRPGGRGHELRPFELGSPLEAGLLGDIDVLVHAAYDLGLRHRSEIWATNVAGTRELTDRASAEGVGRTVLISSMSAYPGTTQIYGQAKLVCEHLVTRDGGTAVRVGLVYAKDGAGMIGSLRRLARLPVVPLPGRSTRQFVVAEGDVGIGILAVVDARELAGEVIGLAHPDPVSFRHILSSLAAGREPRIIAVPWKPVYRLMRSAERLGLDLPVRADSMLGLVRPAPDVPRAAMWARLGVPLRPFSSLA